MTSKKRTEKSVASSRLPSLALPVNEILCGDSLEILEQLPEKSVNLVFADPPYNLQLRQDLWRPNMTQVDAVDDEWDKFDSFASYDTFTKNWLSKVRRVMKDDATIWVSGTYHNIFRVGSMMQSLGFWVLNTIVWDKPNAMPNFRGKRLKNDAEFVIWAKKSERSSYTFNHHLMKQFNAGKQLGSVWTIPLCSGAERLRDESGKKLHPTQKPEALLERIILASSKLGDIVLDPFMGSGTTAAVAKRLNRRWIGIERELIYVAAAAKRLDSVKSSDDYAALIVSEPVKRPRISFASLLQQGMLQPGQQLYFIKDNVKATILPDGRIKAGDYIGSIHRVGAQLLSTPFCNGWTHWLFTDAVTGERKLIDVLRNQHQATD